MNCILSLKNTEWNWSHCCCHLTWLEFKVYAFFYWILFYFLQKIIKKKQTTIFRTYRVTLCFVFFLRKRASRHDKSFSLIIAFNFWNISPGKERDSSAKGLEALWHADVPVGTPPPSEPPYLNLQRVCIPVAGSFAWGIRRLASDLHHHPPSQSFLPRRLFLRILSLACRLFSSSFSQDPLEENNKKDGEGLVEKEHQSHFHVCKVTLMGMRSFVAPASKLIDPMGWKRRVLSKFHWKNITKFFDADVKNPPQLYGGWFGGIALFSAVVRKGLT